MSQSRVTVIDECGRRTKLKLRRCREHEAAGRGRFVDGVFVFHRRRPVGSSSVASSGGRSRRRVSHSPTLPGIVRGPARRGNGYHDLDRSQGLPVLPPSIEWLRSRQGGEAAGRGR